MSIWQFRWSLHRWTLVDGTLTDQARLWLNELFKTVTTAGEDRYNSAAILAVSVSQPACHWLTRESACCDCASERASDYVVINRW